MIYLVIITTLMICILTGFVMYIVYRYRKNQINHTENLEQIKLGYEKSLLEIQLEIQEKTLQHVSKEIHDNCNQKLSLAKLHLTTMNKNTSEAMKVPIENSICIISGVIEDLSNISHSMSSEILIANGLLSALKNEISQIEKLKLFNIEMQYVGEDLLLETNIELVLFRIAQEAFHNIIKHSRAQNVKVTIEFSKKEISLHIVDDGVGFEMNTNKIEGIGLANMAQRTKLMNGNFFIQSTPNIGTHLISKIPL